MAAVVRARYTTSSLDEATELIRTQYAHMRPSYSPGDDQTLVSEFEAATGPTGVLRIDRVVHTMNVLADAPPVPGAMAAVTRSGRNRWRTAHGEEADTIGLMPTWDGFTADFGPIDTLVCVVAPVVVAHVGAGIADLDPAAVRFTGMAAVSPDQGRLLARTMDHLKYNVLADDEIASSPLIVAEGLQQLATTLLLTFPNTALDVLADPGMRGPGRVEPATVRRAVQFIDEHAHEPIGLPEIFAAARLDTRALQIGSRRFRGRSPSDELRRVRLARAHADLQAAGPTRGGTVHEIAARWGFASSRRFMAEYRAAYGRPAAETLHQ